MGSGDFLQAAELWIARQPGIPLVHQSGAMALPDEHAVEVRAVNAEVPCCQARTGIDRGPRAGLGGNFALVG